MKRTLLLFIAVAIVATLSAGTIPIIFGGGGMTWISGEDTERTDSIFGFMIGAAMEVDTNAPFIMEYGGRFRTTGYGISLGDSGTEYEGNYTYTYEYKLEGSAQLNYLDLFAKAKYEIPFTGGMYLLPFVGYAAGILLTAKSEYDYSEKYAMYYYGNLVDNYSESDSGTEDFKENCNALNHTMLFGADLLINEKFIIGIEYDLGLAGIIKDADENITTNAFMFKVGMMF